MQPQEYNILSNELLLEQNVFGEKILPRKCLNWDEVIELIDLLTEVFSVVSDLRNRNPIARWIQFPKIPSILSESLCILERGKLFPGCSNAISGGRTCDVMVLFPNAARKTAEIKATGQSAFEELSEKDISADFLVWVYFGRFFEDQNEEIKAYVMENPGRIFHNRVKITLEKFRSADSTMHEVVLGH